MSFANLTPEARIRYNANRRERHQSDPEYRAKRNASSRQSYIKRGHSYPETEASKANRSYIRHLKETTSCQDCGLHFPYYVMEFDHTRGEKTSTVTSMCSCNRDKLLAEIAKCDLVCANCHSIRTHQRGQYSSNKRKRKIVEAVQ